MITPSQIASSLLFSTFFAVLTAASLSCSRPQSGSLSSEELNGTALLTIKGSDTMLHLVTAWSEEFMNRR